MATQTPLQEWRIVDSKGKVAFEVDSVVAVKFKGAAKVANFPVEKGSFASYNKVVTPNETTLRMNASGAAKVAALVKALTSAKNGTDLFDIITPKGTYTSMTLVDFSYTSEASQGATLMSVDTQWLEIRQVEMAYSTETIKLPPAKVKKPASASKADAGKVQEQPPSQTWSLVGKSPSEIRAHAKAQAGY